MSELSINSIFEERTQTMISEKDGKFTVRRARFLKPCAKTTNQAIKFPKSTQLFTSQTLQQWPSKVCFKGWKTPQKRWEQWVDKLALKHKPIWEKAGIFNAIMNSSTYALKSNHDLVLGLSEFWCSETSTFVFPWGEATITLEDIMILGDLPVIGDSVKSPLTGDLVKLEQKLKSKSLGLRNRSSNHGTRHSNWLDHFIDNEKESELEHAAFLTLWLSRYVFSCAGEGTIVKDVFTIAIHLSSGTKLSLAPAVLATLYHDLRILKRHANVNHCLLGKNNSIVVSGPFQLVQLWAFKHFPILEPSSPNSLTLGGPRSEGCLKLSSKMTLPLVRSVVKCLENFIWRPYAADLKNMGRMSYYKDVESYIYNSLNLDEELKSFVKCLCACNLVGLDCKEKYMPYRVAMQFGYDQDLPSEFVDFSSTCSVARFFVPARNFKPAVSDRYKDWWKESVLIGEDAIEIPVVAPSVVQEKNNEPEKSEKGIIFLESDGEEQSLSVNAKVDNGTMRNHGYISEDDLPLSFRYHKLSQVPPKSDHEKSNVCFTPSNIKKVQDSNVEGLERIENNALKRKLSTANSKVEGLKIKKEQDSKVEGLERIENNALKRNPCTANFNVEGLNNWDSSNSAKNQDRVYKKIKKGTGDFIIEPVEVDNVSEEISGKGRPGASYERQKHILGNSLDNAIDLDDDNDMETTIKSSGLKHGSIIERLKKLEELLGVTSE